MYLKVNSVPNLDHTVLPFVSSKPYGTVCAPAQLGNGWIAVVEQFASLDWVIPLLSVVEQCLFFDAMTMVARRADFAASPRCPETSRRPWLSVAQWFWEQASHLGVDAGSMLSSS